MPSPDFGCKMLDRWKEIASGELAAVLATVGLGTVSMSVLNPILPLYLTSIGVAPTVLGLMFSVGMVGMLTGEGVWGWVADKLGPKIPLGVGTFVCALFVFGFVLTQRVPAIFLIFFVWGVARSALPPVGRGFIGTTAPLVRKATVMAVYTTIMAASRSVGALMSGFVVDNWGYSHTFYISCGVAVMAGLVMIGGLRRVPLKKPRVPAAVSLTDGLESADRGYLLRTLGVQSTVAALLFLGMGIAIAFLPLLATQVVGVQATEVGILFTIGGVATVIVGVPMGMLADRKGKRLLMVSGLLVFAASMAGMAFTTSFLWLIGFIIIRSIGLAMFSPAAVALLSDTIPMRQQNTAMGIYGVFEDIGVIIGSALAGFVWAAWGPQFTFLIGTVAAGLGALICLVFIREVAGHHRQP